MQVLKINVETKTIEKIDIGKTNNDIYSAIGNGCNLFEVPVSFENGDGLFCDEEALLRQKDIKGGFMMPDWRIPIIGNAIIIGSTRNGNSCDCKTKIEDIKNKVRFFDQKICQEYASKII